MLNSHLRLSPTYRYLYIAHLLACYHLSAASLPLNSSLASFHIMDINSVPSTSQSKALTTDAETSLPPVSQRQPTFFLSHGGGPWPWMMTTGDSTYDHLNTVLNALPSTLPSPPTALLVISGHWEAADVSIMSNPHPPMYYDYGGFPPHTYKISYPAPGHPLLATRVQALLQTAGIPSRLDGRRGFDHGTFTIGYAMYPKADIPLIQLSLQSGYDPELHLRMGEALEPLRDEGVLIVGSGLSYHNMQGFRRGGGVATEQSRQFDGWLRETMGVEGAEERRRRLVGWEKAPAAREAHPQEDHLIPLMVAAGAAGKDKATVIYNEMFRGVAVSSFRFG